MELELDEPDDDDEPDVRPPLLDDPLEDPPLLPPPPPPPLRFSRWLPGSAWMYSAMYDRRDSDVTSSGIAAACAVVPSAAREIRAAMSFMV